ncbi:hypothetical protein [Pseudodonghicola sp.]|uniref:hypothetical protein n=1 Tax=Pseudodonghicola sp. TaxID=1969463 RepID=UPI003A97279E
MTSLPSALAASALALSLAAAPALAADRLNAASWYPPSHSMSTVLYGLYAEKANEYSNGALDVTADLGSALITPRGAMQSLADGLVDVTVHMGQYTPSELNISTALEEVAVNYVDVPTAAMVAAITDFSLHDPQMLDQWKRNGVVYGGPYITEAYKLICTAPVTTLEEAKGKRVRMPNRAMSAFAQEIGMIPVSLSGNEQYSALDKGVLDCTAAMYTDTVMRKVTEVTSDATEIPLTIFWAGFAWAYNPRTWDGLTAEERGALFHAEASALAQMLIPGPQTDEELAREALPGLGVTIHQPAADLTAALASFRAETAATAVDIAESAYHVDNAADLYARFDATVKKWQARVSELGLDTLGPDNKATFEKMLTEEVFGSVDLATYGVN